MGDMPGNMVDVSGKGVMPYMGGVGCVLSAYFACSLVRVRTRNRMECLGERVG